MSSPSLIRNLFGRSRREVDRSDARVKTRLEGQLPEFFEIPMKVLPAVPSLISQLEQRYLYWLTSHAYSAQGAVVELGSFLGSSAMHLGAGLRDGGFNVPLWCFDRFEWSRSAGWSERFGVPLPDKADYRPLFLENVGQVYPQIRAIKTEIKRMRWRGGLVEILYLDAPKRLPDISAALTQFAPHLEPRFSLIVCDDYNHAPSFELAACLSQLASKLQLVHAIPDSSTVSFMLTDRLTTAETTQQALSFRSWTAGQAKERWATILAPLPPSARERLELGLAMLLHELGDTAEAVELVHHTELSDSAMQRWRGWATPVLYKHYAPVFDAIGVGPASERRLFPG